jgi:hypothetical protein
MSNIIIEGVPSLEEAREMLKEAEQLNPGPWVEHSLYVAEGARLIASYCKGMDEDSAFILGLLHDIGRRFGVTAMRHMLDGYKYTKEKGYGLAAKICITHSCPTKNIDEAGKWDCSAAEYDFVKDFLRTVEYDDYDRLIQLCDSLALPNGFTLVEKRLVDVALRHGVDKYTVPKWKAILQLKQYFEAKTGKSIYKILPGVVENTFEL